MNNSLQMEPARPEVLGTPRRAPSAGHGGARTSCPPASPLFTCL